MDVLLHYYAKHISPTAVAELPTFARAETLDLDLVPSLDSDGNVTVQLLWKGDPVAGRKITIRGGTIKNPFTGEDGRITFRPKKPGMHTFLGSFEEKKAGTDPADGRAYVRVRHATTLTLEVP